MNMLTNVLRWLLGSFTKTLRWVLVSSADPTKVSLMVRSAVLGVIPFAMQGLGLVCAIGYTCISLDTAWYEALAQALADFTFYFLSLVSIVGVVFGLVRKAYLTVTGQNPAIGKDGL